MLPFPPVDVAVIQKLISTIKKLIRLLSDLIVDSSFRITETVTEGKYNKLET